MYLMHKLARPYLFWFPRSIEVRSYFRIDFWASKISPVQPSSRAPCGAPALSLLGFTPSVCPLTTVPWPSATRRSLSPAPSRDDEDRFGCSEQSTAQQPARIHHASEIAPCQEGRCIRRITPRFRLVLFFRCVPAHRRTDAAHPAVSSHATAQLCFLCYTRRYQRGEGCGVAEHQPSRGRRSRTIRSRRLRQSQHSDCDSSTAAVVSSMHVECMCGSCAPLFLCCAASFPCSGVAR